MSVTSRKVSESVVQTVHIVRPNHLNAAGRLFGGILMQWIDEVVNVYNHIAEKSHVENEMSKMNLPETIPAVV